MQKPCSHWIIKELYDNKINLIKIFRISFWCSYVQFLSWCRRYQELRKRSERIKIDASWLDITPKLGHHHRVSCSGAPIFPPHFWCEPQQGTRIIPYSFRSLLLWNGFMIYSIPFRTKFSHCHIASSLRRAIVYTDALLNAAWGTRNLLFLLNC